MVVMAGHDAMLLVVSSVLVEPADCKVPTDSASRYADFGLEQKVSPSYRTTRGLITVCVSGLEARLHLRKHFYTLRRSSCHCRPTFIGEKSKFAAS